MSKENYAALLRNSIGEYLAVRGSKGPWQISGCRKAGFSGAVIIPALAETGHLFATLHALARNPAELLDRFLVLVVVNHRIDAPPEDKADNHATLRRLERGEPGLEALRLAWVNAAGEDLQLPLKGGGVGLARKIGFDLALTRLDYADTDPLLISLDADTLVRPDYLPAIVAHFQNKAPGGAVLHFCHQQADSEPKQQAIMRYELFLRSYVSGLAMAGSPYAFHTVGSAMACKTSAYVKMGGMNNRTAGEDFYFLQQLHRTSGVGQVAGTVVFPSSRPSHRVPFGTGRSISRLLANDEEAVLFYRPECYRILQQWLKLAMDYPDACGDTIREKAVVIAPSLAEYLDTIKIVDTWNKLRQNHRNKSAFAAAFHGWFDGLKTMKLIHHLSAGPFPRCEPGLALPDLLEWSGVEPVSGLEQQLALLRRMSQHYTIVQITQT